MDSSTIKLDDPDVLRRRVIDSMISNICLNSGFNNADIFALQTLSEMFVSFICQLSVQTKLFADLQNRTEPTIHDVASSLIELGIDLRSIYRYMKTLRNPTVRRVAQPPVATIPNPPPVLHAVKPRPHFGYIYDHFPSFPDPHTYILTECGIKNEREYSKIRELIAEQKLNMEKALVRFKLRNDLLKYPSKQLSILNEETNDTTFMLIKNYSDKPDCPSYLKGLL